MKTVGGIIIILPMMYRSPTRVNDLIAQARARQTLRRWPVLARSKRIQAGITQREIGDVLGVTGVTISRWETGKRLPRGDLARRYLALLDAACEEVGR